VRIVTSLVLGLFFGVVGAMLQTFVVRIGSVPLPVGAALVLVALVPIARACAWWAGSRWGASAFSIGWLATTLLLATTSRGGDLVVSNGTRQMTYLVVGAMILAAASGFPLLPEEDEPVEVPREPVSNDA